MAIDSYFNVNIPEGSGECYVKVYGILQVLVVQQDAAKLFEALGRTWPETPALLEIRRIGNDVVGHPTKRKDGASFHFISRVTLKQEGFQLISERKGDDDVFEDVDIRQLIDEQNRHLTQLMAGLVANLAQSFRVLYSASDHSAFLISTLGNLREESLVVV